MGNVGLVRHGYIFMYKFKGKQSYRGIHDADPLGKELETIREKNGGRLKLDDIVNEAKDPKNPLHPAFTWHDITAAKLWRRKEAEELLKVVVIERDDREIPAFLNIKIRSSEPEHYFQNVTVLTVDEFHSALNEAKKVLTDAVSKLDQVRALSPKEKIGTVQKVLTEVKKSNERLSIV